MPKVFVTQEASLDFTPAELYGEIKFLTRNDLNNIKGSLHNEGIVQEISAKLDEFDPQEDWVVVAGSPYITALVFMLLGYKGHRSVKLLRWNNRDFIYMPMYLDLRKGI